MKVAITLSLALAVGCASEAVVQPPVAPAPAPQATEDAPPAPQQEEVAAAQPTIPQPPDDTDLQIARRMLASLRDHHDATERKRIEDREKFEELMSRPMGLGGFGELGGAGSGGFGGLGLSGSGVGGGGAVLGGGGSLGGMGTLGTGAGGSKPTTTKKPGATKKPAAPKKPSTKTK